MDPLVIEVLFSACHIGYENKLHRPLGRGKGRRQVVGLTMRQYKAHVDIRDANEGMLLLPRMDAEFHGVSSRTGRTRTTKKGVSLLSDDEGA